MYMRDLIRKILREDERVRRNVVIVKKKLPSIIRYMEETYGNSVKFKIEPIRIGYVGMEDISDCVHLNVYVEDDSLLPSDVKSGIIFDLKNIFNIDIRAFGACFYVTVYKKTWVKI